MQVHKATVHGEFPIFFGEDARDLLLEQIDAAAPDKVLIVTDRTVEALHVEGVRENVPHAYDVETIIFNEGEENKNLATLEHVAGDLIRAGATDRSLVLNVGGGVAMNVGGLAASLIGHGVRFAHVPTTFAAQWSAANSNRQAINFIGGRNLLGLYRSPLFVICDPYFVETEEPRAIAASVVDFARHAVVLGGEAFARADKALGKGDALGAGAGLRATLQSCLEHALALGKSDPGETARAALEGYGLSIARALEALADGRLSHLEAVYYGMKISAAAAQGAGIMPEGERARHDGLLEKARIGAAFPAHVRTDQLIYKLHGNNKTESDGLKMVLLEGIGKVASEGNGLADAVMGRAVEEVRGK